MYGNAKSIPASPLAEAAPNEETSVAAPETADTASQPSGQSNQEGSNEGAILFPLSRARGESTFFIQREVDGVVTVEEYPDQDAAQEAWERQEELAGNQGA